MKYIRVFGTTICRAKRLRKKLDEARKNGDDKKQHKLFYFILGIYDSRILGFCLYRGNI